MRATCRCFRAERGTYAFEVLRGFELAVVPSELKDLHGTVDRVVG